MRIFDFAFRAGLYSFVPLLQKVIGLLTIPIVTTALIPEEYGVVLIMTNALLMTTLFLNFGMQSALTTYFCQAKTEEERKSFAGTTLLFRLLTFTPVILVFILFRNLFSESFFEQNIIAKTNIANTLTLAFMACFLTMLVEHGSLLLKCLEKHFTLLIFGLINIITTPAVVIYLVYFQAWGAEAIFTGTIIGNLIVLPAYFWVLLAYLKPEFDIHALQKLVVYGLPLFPSNLAYLIVMNTSGFLINAFVSLEQAGIFSVANSYAAIITVLTFGFTSIWAPFVQNRHDQESNREILPQIHRLFGSILLIGACFLSLFSAEAIYILTHDNFHSAYHIAPLIIFSIGLYTMGHFFAIGIEVNKKTMIRGKAGILYASLFMALVWPAMNLFGVFGLVLLQIFVFLVMGLYLNYHSHRLFEIPYAWARMILMWVLVGGVVILASQIPLSAANLGLKLLAFVFVCGCPFLFRLISIQDIIMIKSILTERIKQK